MPSVNEYLAAAQSTQMISRELSGGLNAIELVTRSPLSLLFLLAMFLPVGSALNLKRRR
jgi:hypothetical protein